MPWNQLLMNGCRPLGCDLPVKLTGLSVKNRKTTLTIGIAIPVMIATTPGETDSFPANIANPDATNVKAFTQNVFDAKIDFMIFPSLFQPVPPDPNATKGPGGCLAKNQPHEGWFKLKWLTHPVHG